jgi:hypothetical protein
MNEEGGGERRSYFYSTSSRVSTLVHDDALNPTLHQSQSALFAVVHPTHLRGEDYYLQWERSVGNSSLN